MNSYNENLHSSVLSSLESQEMTKKQLGAQLNASMFTLYYAEGAEIIAQEKLDATTTMYQEKQHVNNVVVKNKNMADNLLLSANQQKTYVTQSVTNMAVCASNIQIAANSIVRLASDIGSIYSIINAADYGTQIYQQSFEAYNLINKTAYKAEETSQYAMEASASIAEVATSTVADQAQLTNTSVNNLLLVTTADLNAITAILTTDNDTKSKASIATRSAEGVIKCNTVEHEASKKAYKFNNDKFNQDLIVEVPKSFDWDKDAFKVSFKYYKSPFASKDKDATIQNSASDKPVENYNIILVKDSKKSFFNASAAEDLLKNPSQYSRVSVPPNSTDGKAIVSIKSTGLLDSDGDALSPGVNYVAFLLIIFSERYKKEINTFDEYLSAPSETFSLTRTLNPAVGIKVSKKSDSAASSEMSFSVVKEEKLDASFVDYRCFLLPYPDDLLTNEDITTLEDKIETLELQEEIVVAGEEVKSLTAEIESLKTAINAEGAKTPKADAKNAADSDLAKQKSANFKDALNEAQAKLLIATNELKKLNEDLAKFDKKSKQKVLNDKAFYFNLNLAENIPAGNYTSAHHIRGGSELKAHIDTTTTDNFGNPLVENKSYIPVVLSYYSGPEVNKNEFTNSLSDWENTTPFPYSTTEDQNTSTN